MTSDEDAISVEFTATIANTGVKPAEGFSAVLRLYGTLADCADSNPRTCQVLVFEQPIQIPGLGGHATYDVVWTVALPNIDNLAALTDIYIAQVDVDCDGIVANACQGNIEESDETNNSLETPVVISGWRAVDLSVADLVMTIEEDTDFVILTATVANTGVKSANGFSVMLRLFGKLTGCTDSDTLTCEVPVFEQLIQIPGLGGQATYDVVWTVDLATIDGLAALTDGNFIAQVDVDCDGIIAGACQGHIEESDETNNSIRSELLIEGEYAPPVVGEGADLMIQSFHAVELSGAPSATQIWATIVNQGSEDAGEFYVVFYYIDAVGERVKLPSARVRGLAAGTDTSVLRQFDSSLLDAGYHVAGILVDIDNDVPETNEANNSRETDLLIR